MTSVFIIRSTDMSAAFPLVVVLICMTTSQACLTNCYCGQLGHYISAMICNNMEWTRIPSNLDTSLQAVDFSSNEIDLLGSGDFRGMRDLKSVELQSNSIQDVPADIFREVEALQMVDLSFNNIASLPRELFRYNARLEKLYLKQNPLSTVSDAMPLLASNSLSILDISYCGITKLRDVSFSSLQNLTNLTVVGNNFTYLHISVIKPLKNLKRIEASDNEFDCKDANVRETVSYLKNNLVDVIPPDLCTNNDTQKNIVTTIMNSTVNTFGIEISANESFMSLAQGTNTTESILIMKEAESGVETKDTNEPSNDYPVDIATAGYVFPAALIIIVVAIALVRNERGKYQLRKERPPMPLPDGYRSDRGGQPGSPGSKVYSTPNGSMHEYACPMLQDEPDHYSEVTERRADDEDGYLPPRKMPQPAPLAGVPAAIHVHSSTWRALPPQFSHSQAPSPQLRKSSRRATRKMTVSMEPLLSPRSSQPVYFETTVPVPDVIGQVGLLEIGRKYIANSYVRVPPRPTYLL